jgi:hypothetical protein
MGWVVGVTFRRRFRPGARTPGTHCMGGWVGSRAGMNTEVRGKILSPLPGIEPRSPGRPVRSQTLYWLSYLAPITRFNFAIYCTQFLKFILCNFIDGLLPLMTRCTADTKSVITVERLKLFLRIRKVSGSILDQEAGCPIDVLRSYIPYKCPKVCLGRLSCSSKSSYTTLHITYSWENIA